MTSTVPGVGGTVAGGDGLRVTEGLGWVLMCWPGRDAELVGLPLSPRTTTSESSASTTAAAAAAAAVAAGRRRRRMGWLCCHWRVGDCGGAGSGAGVFAAVAGMACTHEPPAPSMPPIKSSRRRSAQLATSCAPAGRADGSLAVSPATSSATSAGTANGNGGSGRSRWATATSTGFPVKGGAPARQW